MSDKLKSYCRMFNVHYEDTNERERERFIKDFPDFLLFDIRYFDGGYDGHARIRYIYKGQMYQYEAYHCSCNWWYDEFENMTHEDIVNGSDKVEGNFDDPYLMELLYNHNKGADKDE